MKEKYDISYNTIIRDERGVVIAYRGEDKFISIGDNYYNGLISDL